MAEKNKQQWGINVNGLFLSALLLILVAASLWLFIGRRWWFPPLASAQGVDIDHIFYVVLVVTGVVFVLTQCALALFVLRFGARGNEPASYWHESKALEITWTLVTAAILSILVLMGQSVWAKIYFTEPPPDAVVVEVTGQQFQWSFRYPGKDGVFGRTDPKLVSPDNQIGRDLNDPAGKDDIFSIGNMHLPVDRPVRLRLRSLDVIHSFFLPHFRVKQDAVPGMNIEIWFTPTRTGEYEIACAELCGLGHYRMKGSLTVESQEEFQRWLDEQLAQSR